MKFIDSTNFVKLIKKLTAEGELYYPFHNEETGNFHLKRATGFPLDEELDLGGYRAVEPMKGVAQHARVTVAEYPSENPDEITDPDNILPSVVLGAKGCDINAMNMVDKVQVEGEFTDPLYKIRRDKMFVVGADCDDCKDSCFCTLLGKNPWPEDGYDLTVSKVSGGYLIEAGSERGEKVLADNEKLTSEARDGQIKARDEKRQKVIADIAEKNGEFPDDLTGMPEILREALSDEIWNELAKDCVECGACTNICPTCYCFLLFDRRTDGGHFRRLANWDSCQVTGYARMAGMLNPRPGLADRVKHRFYHKYDYLVLSHDDIFCTGCGRCIDTCSASIDLREVMRRVKEKVNG
jgi:ferredoxin